MNKTVLIATAGEDMSPLFVSLKEFSVERIHLLTSKENLIHAQKGKEELDKFNIPVKIHTIENTVWEDTFKIIGNIASFETEHDIIVNVGIGDFNSRCAATCASFVNGLKAFSIDNNNNLFLLPVMKFSYYSLLTDKKMQILKILSEREFTNFDELSKSAKMSMPLVSYHINGNLKSDGLKKLGLLDTKETNGRTVIFLTTLGHMLLKGYIK